MKVGFLVQPTTVDFKASKRLVVEKFPILKRLPASFIHNVLIPYLPVGKLRMGEATNIESLATGRTTAMVYWGEGRDPVQMLRDQPLDRLIKAARCCEGEGAELVGLGAYTSIVGNQGKEIAAVLNRLGVGITTGNSLTAYSSVEGLLAIARQVGYNPSECTAAVIGAGGATGSVAAQLLSRNVRRTILVGRPGGSDQNLSWLVEKVGRSISVQSGLDQALREATLIIAVTSNTGALQFDPELLQPGAIICDIARPRDIAVSVGQRRADVLVFDGAILRVPGAGYQCDWNYGFETGTTYACMAETMILGLERYQGNFSIGRELDIDNVEEIGALAARHGFSLAGYRAFDQPITAERLDHFAIIVRQEARHH